MLARDYKFVSQVVALAETLEEFGDARVAAVLVNKNAVISYGFNSSKSHPIATRFERREGAIYPHAEIMCLFKASKILPLKELSKCTLYVGRVKRPTRKSNLFIRGLSKPCPACEAAILAFGIKRVVYTLDDEHCCGCFDIKSNLHTVES